MIALSIEDKIELLELAGRYGDAIDDRNWDAMDSIFTEDAEFRVPDLDIEMISLSGIKEFMLSAGKLHPAAHLMTNIHSFVDEEGIKLRFRGIFPMNFPLNKAGSDGSTTILHGSYYDDVVKTDQGWRVKNKLFSSKRL